MNNKVTFNRCVRPTAHEQKQLLQVMGLVPADIVCPDRGLPELRVLRRKGRNEPHHLYVMTQNEWTVDTSGYDALPRSNQLTFSVSNDARLLLLALHGPAHRVSYSFALHEHREVEHLPSGDYRL